MGSGARGGINIAVVTRCFVDVEFWIAIVGRMDETTAKYIKHDQKFVVVVIVIIIIIIGLKTFFPSYAGVGLFASVMDE